MDRRVKPGDDACVVLNPAAACAEKRVMRDSLLQSAADMYNMYLNSECVNPKRR
jgi:hypothetical protein